MSDTLCVFPAERGDCASGGHVSEEPRKGRRVCHQNRPWGGNLPCVRLPPVAVQLRQVGARDCLLLPQKNVPGHNCHSRWTY